VRLHTEPHTDAGNPQARAQRAQPPRFEQRFGAQTGGFAGPLRLAILCLVKYLGLIYGNEKTWYGIPPERRRAVIAEVDAFNQRLRDSGELVAVDGLLPPARTVRASEGVPVVSDGPYLEAKEHVGSYFIVDVASEERALEIARSYPAIGPEGGGVELWLLMSSAR
jgi:hypothetical protein